MNEFSEAFQQALRLIGGAEPALVEIMLLSLQVSVTALALATILALPVGGVLALFRFPGRGAAIVLVNALMGLPPVVVGLVVYLLLSRSGPLGSMALLFTPLAMIVAQCVLVTPIIISLSRQVFEDLWNEYEEQLRSFGAGPLRSIGTLLWEGRYALLTVVLAGFGRAIAEVGAVLIVGGNIAHVTRVMTTAIALETSKGDLALALGLGILLISMSIAVNASANLIKEYTLVRYG